MIILRKAAVLILLSACGAAAMLGCGDDGNGVDPSNHDPEIVSLTAVPDTFVANHSSTITVVAEDEDGDALTYDWETQGSEFVAFPGEANTLNLTNCCPVLQPASALVHAIVDDGRGGSDSDTIRVWVVPGDSR